MKAADLEDARKALMLLRDIRERKDRAGEGVVEAHVRLTYTDGRVQNTGCDRETALGLVRADYLAREEELLGALADLGVTDVEDFQEKGTGDDECRYCEGSGKTQGLQREVPVACAYCKGTGRSGVPE